MVRKLKPRKEPVSTTLLLPVRLVIRNTVVREVVALIDTGAAIPLVFRKGLFPESDLSKSTWPVKFVTASGAVMPGGTTGLSVEIVLPVLNSEIVPPRFEGVSCAPVWAYEAELHNTDVIIGYPYLAGFGLGVDPGANALTMSAIHRKSCRTMDRMSDASDSVLTEHSSDGSRTTTTSPESNVCSQAVSEWIRALVTVVLLLTGSRIQQNSLLLPGQTLEATGEVMDHCPILECACHEMRPVEAPPDSWSNGDFCFKEIREAKPHWFTVQSIEGSARVPQPKNTSWHKRQWSRGDYSISRKWFDKIVAMTDVEPTVDAFANAGNRLTEKYWDLATDAFTQDWSDEVLWINPPFDCMERVVSKILSEQAHGLMIVPCWPRQVWFSVLESISINWIDLPATDEVFETVHGHPLGHRPGWTTRVVLFNAFDFLRRTLDRPLRWTSDSVNEFHLRELVTREAEVPVALPYGRTRDLCTAAQVDLYSVIESTEEHPEAKPFMEAINRDYEDVLHRVTLARDVDPELRGPYGVAVIELKDGAIPQQRKPFRMIGEKEEAFRALIAKFLERGWIEPTNSEWGSQAFLVTKPTAEKTIESWRMVVDYRYVNQVTKDFPYPLPLIEDLICKESRNRLWSIFDLESGFHQITWRRRAERSLLSSHPGVTTSGWCCR